MHTYIHTYIYTYIHICTLHQQCTNMYHHVSTNQTNRMRNALRMPVSGDGTASACFPAAPSICSLAERWPSCVAGCWKASSLPMAAQFAKISMAQRSPVLGGWTHWICWRVFITVFITDHSTSNKFAILDLWNMSPSLTFLIIFDQFKFGTLPKCHVSGTWSLVLECQRQLCRNYPWKCELCRQTGLAPWLLSNLTSEESAKLKDSSQCGVHGSTLSLRHFIASWCFLLVVLPCFIIVLSLLIVHHHRASKKTPTDTHRCFFIFFAPMGWAMANNIDQQTQQNHVVMGRKHFVSETQRAHDRWVR